VAPWFTEAATAPPRLSEPAVALQYDQATALAASATHSAATPAIRWRLTRAPRAREHDGALGSRRARI
jgi:hypothetical protein